MQQVEPCATSLTDRAPSPVRWFTVTPFAALFTIRSAAEQAAGAYTVCGPVNNTTRFTPASSARSNAASVWPGRVSTPRSRATSGKMCPGLRSSAARVLGSPSARMVLQRSDALMPVVTPSRRSTVTVKAVYISSSFSAVGTMSGSSRRLHVAGGSATQITPAMRTSVPYFVQSRSLQHMPAVTNTHARPRCYAALRAHIFCPPRCCAYICVTHPHSSVQQHRSRAQVRQHNDHGATELHAPLVYSTMYAIFSGVALSAARMRSPSFSLSSSSSTSTNSPLPIAAIASRMLLKPGVREALSFSGCTWGGAAAACVAVLGSLLTGGCGGQT